MKFQFWGSRGNIASPGRNTIELGGNTTCVQVFLDEKNFLLLDSGTGITEYASKGIDFAKDHEFHILLTHFHWDHIQGFPFFFPIHNPKAKIHIYSPFTTEILRENIVALFDGTYSPLRDISNLNATIKFHEIDPDGFEIFNAKIDFTPLQHTDPCYGYRIKTANSTLVFATDHENNGNKLNEELVKFAQNADILIHDAQYFKEEYQQKIGWGHSCLEKAIENGVEAKVKRLFLTHHHHSYKDDHIRLYLSRLIRKIKVKERPIIHIAVENRVYDFFDNI